jgi:lysylphosphatidylglycerol synthetase-like protein (DUF2156 family)
MDLLDRHRPRATSDTRDEEWRGELHGEPEPLAAAETDDEKPGREAFEEPPRLERWDLVESRWNLGSVLVLLAGAALAVLGSAAATRTGINETWYRPVEEIGGIRHTPLLATVEAGIGVLLVITGLAGAPGLAAFVSILTAIAAGVAALEPELVAQELAVERWWLIVLVVAGAGLAVLSMVPWPRFVERHYMRDAATARQRSRASSWGAKAWAEQLTNRRSTARRP